MNLTVFIRVMREVSDEADGDLGLPVGYDSVGGRTSFPRYICICIYIYT